MSTQETLTNESVEANVTRDEGCKISLDVLLKPEACTATYEEAFKEVRKRVVLPGFRKGKAPKEMILRHYASHVDDAWRERAANKAIREAVGLANAYPWNQKGIPAPKIDSLSKEEGAKISVSFECEPQVPAIDKKSVELPPLEVAEVTDAMIDERIETFHKRTGTHEDVEKTVEEGDWVRIDIEAMEDKEKPEKVVTNQRVEIADPTILEWLKKLLLGAKKGDVMEGETALNPGATKEEKKAFKASPCRVTLLAVEKWNPPSEEEFLKLAGVESMDEFREKVKEFIHKEHEEEAQKKQRVALWEVILEKFPFDLPESLFTQEKRRHVERLVNSLKQGNTEDKILENEKEIEGRAEKEASESLRKFFIARKVNDDHKTAPAEEEIKDYTAQLMAMDRVGLSGGNEQEMQRIWQAYSQEAYFQLVLKNAENFLLGT